MNNENLTPDKSLEIITQVINEARSKFEENGFIYIVWGVLIFTASLAQYFLLKNEYYSINYYPYFLMPLGAIITWMYKSKQKKKKTYNHINKVISLFWIVLSLNIMVLGFFFHPFLKENLIPILLILMGIGIIISGVSIKNKLLLFSGILINISGLICFWLNWIDHSLLLSATAVIAILIPGIILITTSKKTNV